jgi:UDP-N-acetylglucosamine 2-epimerase
VVVGHSKEKLIIAFNKLIGQEKTIKTNPFGDGKAARRIIDFFEN